jgi:hypothetical protein
MNPIGSTQAPYQPNVQTASGSQATAQNTSTQQTLDKDKSGNVSPADDAQDLLKPTQTASTIDSQGLTAEGKALMQALKEIEEESQLAKQSGKDNQDEHSSDRSFSVKKALTAAVTIGGILLAVA